MPDTFFYGLEEDLPDNCKTICTHRSVEDDYHELTRFYSTYNNYASVYIYVSKITFSYICNCCLPCAQQNEPQNLSTSTSQPMVMVPTHPPPQWHIHPQPVHIMTYQVSESLPSHPVTSHFIFLCHFIYNIVVHPVFVIILYFPCFLSSCNVTAISVCILHWPIYLIFHNCSPVIYYSSLFP